MSQRDAILATIDKLLETGGTYLKHEPVGVVLIYKNEAFLKAVWEEDSNRADNMQALMNAAIDEGRKS
jgi:hypothetical protein